MELKEDQLNTKNAFIEDNKKFIFNVTKNICKKHLHWENDDELSTALITFNNACDTYVEDKGNFFNYAKVLIKNALIDYFKKSSKNVFLIFDHEDKDIEYISCKSPITTYEIQQENLRRREEILAFSEELKKYKLSFEILVDNCPSHKETKDKLLNLAFMCLKESSILEYLHKTKKLPVKQICLLTNSNRKLIEKWRKYILVLLLILSNEEYIYLRSYLNIKVGN
jgi:hypothetical protein